MSIAIDLARSLLSIPIYLSAWVIGLVVSTLKAIADWISPL